jgi:hypothetical protein
VDFGAPLSGPDKFGIPADGPASNAPTALASTVTPSEHGQAVGKLLSKDNPFTAFALVAAVTFGFMAFSTSVRVGHTTASVNLGSTS